MSHVMTPARPSLAQYDYINRLVRETGYNAARIGVIQTMEEAKDVIDHLVGFREHYRQREELKPATRRAIQARMRELSLTKADIYPVASVTTLSNGGGCTEAQGQMLLRHMAGERVEIAAIDPLAFKSWEDVNRMIASQPVTAPPRRGPISRPGFHPTPKPPVPVAAPLAGEKPPEPAAAAAAAPAPVVAAPPPPPPPTQRRFGRPGLNRVVPAAPAADAPDAIPDGGNVPFAAVEAKPPVALPVDAALAERLRIVSRMVSEDWLLTAAREGGRTWALIHDAWCDPPF